MSGTPWIGATSIASTGKQAIDGLLGWTKWDAPAITYSDPDSVSDYQSDYPAWDLRSFAPLGAQQMQTVHMAFAMVEGFTNLEIDYAGPGTGEATMRLANNDADTAYAYSPGTLSPNGDVFFGWSGVSPVVGNSDHRTVLHEIGHALGLKHPHQESTYGTVPTEMDGMEFSLMSYRSRVGQDGVASEAWGHAQTFMMLDIAALQHMYGADFTTNSGDTTYRWAPGSGNTVIDGEVAVEPGGNRIFATIWDGGGVDTYDLSAYATNLDLSLAPGGHSTFSAVQLAHLGGGNYARGNIFNALQFERDPRSLIENAVGGSGNDVIVGNAAANRLVGGSGNDVLRGMKGADVLVGGRGADVFDFDIASHSGKSGTDRIVRNGSAPAFEGAGRAFGDLIDLSDIDANVTLGGNQAFAFGGTDAGHVWASNKRGDTLIRANTDRDDKPEFKLLIDDGDVRASAYTTDDFVL